MKESAPTSWPRERVRLCAALLLICEWLLFFSGRPATAVPILRPRVTTSSTTVLTGIQPDPAAWTLPSGFNESKRPVPSSPDPLHNRR
ncbi:hypothetical protein AXF42_Ash005421 [Apostasia shenzhenica]|uniref:CLAVATA3/ESR (CLE)-related protein 25 n=1 Tax=Apostasia shenzhenica TaxID=1088818 RepID=A0A2I0B6V3_9ASPA|nr:hypothetical protein AXF42_Ash005421 [Apostasia shenzhenica]